jgi:aspartokinase
MSGKSSVQDVVRIIVTRNPYLYRGLRMRVVNYSALARYIQEEVQTTFGEDVDPNTIVTAIMRLSNQLMEPEEPKSPLTGTRLNVVTGISEVLISAAPVKHTELMSRIIGIGVFESYMMSLHQTQKGIRIMTNSPDAAKVKEALNDFPVDVTEGFAELHMRLPDHLEGVEGVLTMVIDVLAQNGVYAVDVSIANNEISIILREDDAGRAFEVLRLQSR